MRKFIPLLALLFLLMAAPALVQAQTEVQLGPRIGYDLGDPDEVFIGAEGRIAIEDFPVVLNPTFDYYFAPENITWFSIGANALYYFPLEEQEFMPYVGGGLGIFRQSVSIAGISGSSSEVGINLIGGAEYDAGSVTPFGQATINVGGDITLFGLSVGVLFDI